jgi:hypothetical protein
MIQHLQHTDIDKVKWDQCISESPYGRIFAYSWFLDIISPGWDGLIEGDYSSVFPLTHHSKYGFTYLYQPFFTQQLGLFSGKQPSAEHLNLFLEIILSDYRFIDINLNSFNLIATEHFEVYLNSTYEIRLSHEYPKLSSCYSENAKRNIKKAENRNVTISNENLTDEVISMFRANQGKLYPRIKDQHFSRLSSVMTEGINRAVGKTYIARDSSGMLCAGAYFIYSHNRYVFLFSGNIPESRDNGAMFLLIDQFIKDHAGQNDLLDFMGSNRESLARFYAGFGAKEVRYPRVKINRLPWWVKWMKKD